MSKGKECNLLKFDSTIKVMRKETGIILAGSVGVIIGLTLFGVRTFLTKKRKAYDDYYADFHRHFEKRKKEDTNEGVEFLAVQ